MITIRKLTTLAPGTRRRKIVRLLEGWERGTVSLSGDYLRDLAGLVQTDHGLSEHVRGAARALGDAPGDVRRVINTLRHALSAELGVAPADWDLLEPAGVPAAARLVAAPLSGVALYLDALRSPFNVGSILRTAAAFGVERVVLSPECPAIDHPRLLRSAMGSERWVTIERGDVDLAVRREREIEGVDASGEAGVDAGGVPAVPLIALELGGEPVAEYAFPGHGVLLLGSEELGLGGALLERADARVSIPMAGVKASLNVAVACGIALGFWSSRAARRAP